MRQAELTAFNFVFEGPPGPLGAMFVEVELDNGKSVRFGTWAQRPDGFWGLRFAQADMEAAFKDVDQ